MMAGRLASALLLLGPLAAPARLQCLDWSKPFGGPGMTGTSSGGLEIVWDLAVFDDGTGRKLCAGGTFVTAGAAYAPTAASYDGTDFRTLAGGLPGGVMTLETLDAGSGPRLYAGNNANGGQTAAWSWDGASWTPLPGISGVVNDFDAFDDGTGRALYAVTSSNGYVYRRTSSSWSIVGAGFDFIAHALQVYDDGSGPALYAGGYFSQSGAQATLGIARWNGTAWNPVGGGLLQSNGAPGQVLDMAVFDDGGGSKLYVGGNFATAGTLPVQNLAAWNGTQWSSVGGGADGEVSSVEPVAIGTTRLLAIAGRFQHAGGVTLRDIALWNGTSFSGCAPLPPITSVHPHVTSFASYDDGAGMAMYASGLFLSAGGVVVNHVARWNGTAWSALGKPRGVNGQSLFTAVTHDDGTGKQLYVGGIIVQAGAIDARLVARFDGTSWSRVGTQAVDSGSVLALASGDFGAGPRLVAGGVFAAIDGVPTGPLAMWNGAAWSGPPGGGVTGSSGVAHVRTLLVDPQPGGDVLYVGGNFSQIGGIAATNVAKFDGTSWTPVGVPSDVVYELALFDDGGGNRLHAAIGATVWRFDGAAWTVLPQSPLLVRALASYDDGVERWLYVGGQFSQAGGVFTRNIARWNGTTWSTFGEGASGISPGSVDAFRVFDDGLGGGPKLFAGGLFTQIGSGGQQGIGLSVMRFDGTSWQGAGANGGVVGTAKALEVFDDGAGPALFAVGDFDTTNLVAARRIARYGPNGAPNCVAVTGVAFCAGDGSASPCPCGNSGLSGHGCQNSSATGGAQLVAQGHSNLVTDDVTLHASGTGASSTMLFFQGTTAAAGGQGASLGDGLRCVSGQQVRLGVRTAAGGMASFGAHVAGDPKVSAAGHVLAPGTRRYQVWYRDAVPFCTSSSFNLSNGLSIRWAP